MLDLVTPVINQHNQLKEIMLALMTPMINQHNQLKEMMLALMTPVINQHNQHKKKQLTILVVHKQTLKSVLSKNNMNHCKTKKQSLKKQQS